MSQYANIKDAFLHCDVDKLILEYCKIPDGESSKVTIERASAEVHAAMERINQTEPEKTEKQNLLIVCKTYEENGEDTFCVEADDIAEWKRGEHQRVSSQKKSGTKCLHLWILMPYSTQRKQLTFRLNMPSSFASGRIS